MSRNGKIHLKMTKNDRKWPIIGTKWEMDGKNRKNRLPGQLVPSVFAATDCLPCPLARSAFYLLIESSFSLLSSGGKGRASA